MPCWHSWLMTTGHIHMALLTEQMLMMSLKQHVCVLMYFTSTPHRCLLNYQVYTGRFRESGHDNSGEKKGSCKLNNNLSAYTINTAVKERALYIGGLIGENLKWRIDKEICA